MAFLLPKLPYAEDALEPYISAKTLSFHYGKHHQKYVDTLNELIEGKDFANMTVEEIVQRSESKLYNNAAQAYNHTFYWYCMAPNSGGEPTGQIGDAISDSFGSFDDFKTKFTQVAATHFGSGWAWLAQVDGKLEIIGMRDADTPIKDNHKPLLALDVWEHAYYLDYQNKRPDYIEAFWKVVNWEFVEKQLLNPSSESLMVPEKK